MSTVLSSKKILFHEYLKPDFVFIPLKANYDLMVTNNQHVYKNGKLAVKDNSYVYSPVSGYIMGSKTCTSYNGKEEQCVVIANDFKEKSEKRNGIKHFNTKTKLEDVLKNKLLNFEKMFDVNATTLLISSLESDNDSFTNSFILKDNMFEILDTIDFLGEILDNIKRIVFVMPNKDTENIARISEFRGTYPKINIKMINGAYPACLKEVLKKEIIPKEEIMFLNVFEVLAIYNAIIRTKTVSERYITISGDALDQYVVINAKIGSLVKPIIQDLVKLTIDNCVFITNSSIGGNLVNINELIVTDDLSGIFINSKKDTLVKECLNCGKCKEVCPVNINPKYIRENMNDEQKLAKAKINDCIKCGLCTHMCPANINLKEYLYYEK